MEHKIILTGPVGAGKTTAISALSDIPVVKTGARANDAVAMRKDQTTVAMDYGVLALDGGVQLHLYGTPGQERFSFMWDILTAGGVGLVLLLDNARTDPSRTWNYFLMPSSGSFTKLAWSSA
jgi:signal recognition particle receptor subunit beta